MSKTLEQNDSLHRYSLQHVGELVGKGITDSFDIFYAEEDDKSIHVVGNGLKYNGEFYDYFQAWIPKSICGIKFDIMGYKSTVWFPIWATIKIYPMNQEKAEFLAKKIQDMRYEAELKREHDEDGGE